MKYFCHNISCKKELKYEELHNVKLTDYKGDTFNSYVCSEECFNEVVNNNAERYLKIYKQILNQKFK